jgi:hypothetical protein
MSFTKTLKSTQTCQGVHVFLVKITELKCESSYVAMRQHHHTEHHVLAKYVMLPHHHI